MLIKDTEYDIHTDIHIYMSYLYLMYLMYLMY